MNKDVILFKTVNMCIFGRVFPELFKFVEYLYCLKILQMLWKKNCWIAVLDGITHLIEERNDLRSANVQCITSDLLTSSGQDIQKRNVEFLWRVYWYIADDLNSTTLTYVLFKLNIGTFVWTARVYGSAEGPPRGVENRNVLSHPDDLRLEAYLIRMT